MKFSVIIPLYNKEAEIERALLSVLSQTLPPFEIVVVDDGSTDGSAGVVERIIARTAAKTVADTKAYTDTKADSGPNKSTHTPPIRLIRQTNAGETAARNRGMLEAGGDLFALLDADDEWRDGFLETIAAMTGEYPGAGIYCTGFDIAKGGKLTPGRTPQGKGIVADFFGEAMHRFVATASSSALPRAVVDEVGGFPEGMRLGGDQYMWTKIALRHPVVFTPERLAVVHASASNRSAAIYTPERTSYSFRDFHDPGNPVINEYIARVELGKAITATVRGATDEGLRAERDFACNRSSRRLWWRLRILNRLPRRLRSVANNAYNRLAWSLAKKGV